MGEGIKCYAITLRTFLICVDLDGNDLPPNEWHIDTLLEELANTPPSKVSVKAELVSMVPDHVEAEFLAVQAIEEFYANHSRVE